MLATKVNDTVITARGADARVDQLVAALPRQRWKRISGGAGAHGERIYDWARVAIRPHWVLARRSVSDPSEIAHYVCYGPVASRLKDLVKVAAARWRSASRPRRESAVWTTTRYGSTGPGTATSPWPWPPSPT
ncbi:hypothetical protein [Streptomyces atratus]|uniref:hypothetical protein n=1 Tax=Streptomyces atratus TaxID=1893 RepID=UPI0037922261